MKKLKNYSNDTLQIKVSEDDQLIYTTWQGKSIDRNPSAFITPILIDVFKMSSNTGKDITLDFREIEYMNSSTITPIIKFLERAKRGNTKIKVVYLSSLKWQELIFSALEIFQTDDKRILIEGLSK